MSLPDPKALIGFLLALLISLTFHEFAHAITALWLGDDTAKRQGRVTLNPMAHLDPMGTIFLLIMALSQVGIGWARPVPVDPRNLRPGPQLGMAIVAVAGPVSNLILALLFVFLLGPASAWSPELYRFVQTVILVNVSLAVFNMLPIPPLDGFNVVIGLLPAQQAYTLRTYAMYGPLVLLALVLMVPGFLGSVINPAVSVILRSLMSLAGTGAIRF